MINQYSGLEKQYYTVEISTHVTVRWLWVDKNIHMRALNIHVLCSPQYTVLVSSFSNAITDGRVSYFSSSFFKFKEVFLL